MHNKFYSIANSTVSILSTCSLVGLATLALAADPKPGSPEMPLVYKGPNLANPSAPDGGVSYSPGVQNIQVYRSTRRPPTTFSTAIHTGYTYLHHQDIACWKGKLFVAFTMGLKDEDVPPSQIMFCSSSDGFNWSGPRNLFPPDMGWSLRFYFYHASNDRMLVFALGPYKAATLSEKTKRTLLVRELKPDEQLGEVYTLINRGPNHPPVFTDSPDAGFVAACQEAYNCRLLLEQQDYGVFLGDRRMKWHDKANWPGGKILGRDDYWHFGKAFCFFHRPDGAVVGLCKLGIVTESLDGGETWSRPVVAGNLDLGGAKEWAQRTPDGRYAMVYPHSRGNRFPMVVTTSDDGITFENMRLVHADVPPQRYAGAHKDMGPQYLRGIAEWAGDAGLDKSSIWVVYSVNKEDIWVSRIPVPILADTKGQVHDSFDELPPGPRVPGWNIYSPAWAPVRIAKSGDNANACLELSDRDPVDYARAVRTFVSGAEGEVSFRLLAGQNDRGRLEIDLLGDHNSRPVRMLLNDRGRLSIGAGKEAVEIGGYESGQWNQFLLKFKDGRFSLFQNGKAVTQDSPFSESASAIYAISFRTGEFRGKVSPETKVDLQNTEEPAPLSVYQVDDVIADCHSPSN